MPELKHTFQGGKMEKDKDERIVPNGQYREALNISVSTSEDSDVGAAQNILGNICVTQAIRGRTQTNTTLSGLVNDEYYDENGGNFHVAQIVDPQSDMLYRFVHTASPGQGIWMDRIIEYDTTKSIDTPWQEKENAVVVDIFRVRDEIIEYETVGNKARIKVRYNTNQLRWGMKVVMQDWFNVGGMPFIEDIDYVTGEIWLDRNLPEGVFGEGEIFFLGDRNLNFSSNQYENSPSDLPRLIRKITGINIVDGMLFWTDNRSEPKKINIERCKMGSNTALWSTTTGLIGRYSGFPIPKIDDFNQHTVLVVKDEVKYDCVTDDILGGERAYKQDTVIDTPPPPEPDEVSEYDAGETSSFNLEQFAAADVMEDNDTNTQA